MKPIRPIPRPRPAEEPETRGCRCGGAHAPGACRCGGACAKDRAQVTDALGSCTLRERLVLVLLLYERLTPAEAAEALGLSVRQVESAYRHALEDLGGALEDGGPRSVPVARRPARPAVRRRLAGTRGRRPSRAVARLAVEVEAPSRRVP